jgi:hypothetical protein
MQKTLMTVVAATIITGATAQDKKWYDNIKLSGYGMVQYQGSDKENDENNSFNLRLARVSAEARPHKDFYAKAQMQVNGNTSEGSSAVRLVDLFGEWQKYKFLMVKAGQFKRPFTFENPMHPITQGFMSYSQSVSKLAGFSDRSGEHASNGRDIGLQLQGDLLPNAVGRALLHYQVGIFNGQGINVKDVDNRKDIIGGLWVMPVQGLRIGAFGWTGSRGTKNDDGSISSTPKNRYALSAEYAHDDWTFRSEYIRSQGFDVAHKKGDKADGYYALVIAPVQKQKMHVKARYDVYRDQKSWGTSKTFYEVGADYVFTKNLQLNVEYARVNERSSDSNYNMVDVELDFRF